MNELKNEKSPYLLQHAGNPVHWKAWSSQSLEIAKKEHKPLFVSIGYSTCHWCHVMEHESFEDQAIADFLNQNFVCIKIDREEHPDVDSIYMNSVQLMTGRGGWPLNVFLDADLKPFYGGTYFRAPVFLNLLHKIHEAWTTDYAALTAQGTHLLEHLRNLQNDPAIGELPKLPLETYFGLFNASYDQVNGGKVGAPKFPLSYDLVLLTKLESDPAKKMVRHTISKMARSGTYDQLEGGLHRYSTDGEWKVPHFEKMLYDQSAFIQACIADFRASKNPDSLFIAKRTIDYVINRLQTPNGAFYSAEDADSEGDEGKFYRWDNSELKSLLLPEAFERFTKTLDWPAHGNFEGHYVIHITDSESLSKWHLTHSDTIRTLNNHRAKRPRPITDTKVLTAWNGLFLSALANYIQVSGDRDYEKNLTLAVQFIKTNLVMPNGELYRRWADGESKYRGTLADYSFLIAGLIDTFCVMPSLELHQWIEALFKKQEELFSGDGTGLYWSTPHDEPNLLIREIETYDNVEPSANSIALKNLSLWYSLTGDEIYLKRLGRMSSSLPSSIINRPHGYPALLDAALTIEKGLSTFFIVSSDKAATSEEAKNILMRNAQTVLVLEIDTQTNTNLGRIAWLKDKLSTKFEFAVYHCRNQVCEAPITR